MKFAKKVVIAVDLNERASDTLKKIKNLDFLSYSEIHFVHVFKTVRYIGIFFDFPMSFPLECDRIPIRESTIAFLSKISKEYLPEGFSGKIFNQCLFAVNPKAEFSEYVKEQKANLIIIPTHKKHGFFESSFADYVNKHTDVELLLLKV